MERGLLEVPAAHSGSAEQAHPALLVFHLSDKIFALPLASIERLVPIAALAHPPGMPALLEGVLNLAGEAVPTLRLDRLFALPEQRVGLYSTLVVVRARDVCESHVREGADGRFALLVEQASHILQAGAGVLFPIGEGFTWNGCVDAVVQAKEGPIPVLCPAKMLLETEREALRDFQVISRRRMDQWQGGAA